MSAQPAPQNLAAEENVIGAILLAGVGGPEASARTLAAVKATGLTANDFYRSSHGRIYEAALSLAGEGAATDAVIVAGELDRRGELADVGGAGRVHELAALVSATANVAHYARLVVEKAEQREQFSVAAELRTAALNGGLDVHPELRERLERLQAPRRLAGGARVEFVTFAEFVARPEPDAEPLVLDADGGTIFSATGLGMEYGTGGAGKTTLMLDGVMHFAAGVPWLGGRVVPVRKLRVGWIENEGPREEFRRKLERKLELWRGRVKRHRLRVLDRPWSQYDLRRDDHRAALAGEVTAAGVDLLVVGPLHRLGMEGGGTPDEVRAFVRLIEDVQRRAERPVFVLVLHHDNRAGQVSGAWEGVPDLLVHVTPQGNGRTRVYWQKARWSSLLHATAVNLTWTDGEGFAVEEKDELDDDVVAERIVTAISDDPGIGWSRVEERTPGMGDKRRRDVRDALLRSGVIVNVAKDESGERVRLDHCPARRPASLYLADDPTIRHLRLDPAAGEPQIAAAVGEGATADLRPAAPSIETQAAEPQPFTPSLDLGADANRDNNDDAAEAAERSQR